MFALDRAYQVVLSTRLPGGFGHFIAVTIYSVGFLVGLLTLREECRGRRVTTAATWLSYTLLVVGSLWLLVVLFGDTLWVQDHPPPPK